MTVSPETGLAVNTTIVVAFGSTAVQVAPPLAAQLAIPRALGMTLSTLPLPTTFTVSGISLDMLPGVKATVHSAEVTVEVIAIVPVLGSVPAVHPGPQETVVVASAGVAFKFTDVVPVGILPVQVPLAAAQAVIPTFAGKILSTVPVPVPVTLTVKGISVLELVKSAVQLTIVAVGVTETVAVSGVAPTLQSVPLQVTVPPLAVKVTAVVSEGITASQLVPPAKVQFVIPRPTGKVLSTLPLPFTVTVNLAC